MFDILKFSNTYLVKRLDENNVDEIYDLCLGNELFYQYSMAVLSRKQIIDDFRIVPDGKTLDDKYFIGYYDDNKLIAVMDLIDGYPNKEDAFIGFFMMNKDYQLKEIGTKIINDLCDYLSFSGYRTVKLGIDENNPQANHFWNKNGFKIIDRKNNDGHIILYAHKDI